MDFEECGLFIFN